MRDTTKGQLQKKKTPYVSIFLRTYVLYGYVALCMATVCDNGFCCSELKLGRGSSKSLSAKNLVVFD